MIAALHVVPLSLPAHVLLQLLAYAAGFQLYLYLRRRWPGGATLTLQQTAWIVGTASLCAFAGSKLLAWADAYSAAWAHRGDWRVLLSYKTIVGAFLGGWVGIELMKKRLRLSASGDVYVFPLILGLTLARLGGFLNGLKDAALGTPTSLPWAVDFGDGVGRHPIQLYEIGFLLVAAAALGARLHWRKQRGCMFSQFMLGYLAFRFLADFLRVRETLPVVPVTALQVACLAGIGYAVYHWNDTCCLTERAGGEGAGAKRSAGSPATADEGVGTTFLELTTSLCPHCLKKIDAKIVAEDGRIYMHKFCPAHGIQRVLIASDAAFWRESRRLYKPPTPPLRRNTAQFRGCPYDCGLCPDHEQHSCLAIVEITDQCDMECPLCYACSTRAGAHRPLAQVQAMLDAVVANEGQVNVVQISGGEPALHPELFAILDAVRARPIRHLMLNTNGRRIAGDPEFVKRLAAYMPGFEVYLQFDSLRPAALRALRGADLSTLRRQAIAALNDAGISTTLVVTLMKGVNDDQIGEILDFATQQPCIRGVTFQPVQSAGRLGPFDPAIHRLTLSEVRSAILAQHKLFTPRDIAPVPCHPECLAMAYALRRGKKLIPLSRLLDPKALLKLGGNTICYEQDPALRGWIEKLFSAGASPMSAAGDLQEMCCPPPGPAPDGHPVLPRASSQTPAPVDYRQIFRIIIMQFMDAWSLDIRSLKRSCVHIVHPDITTGGQLIPFDTYNLLYRTKISSPN